MKLKKNVGLILSSIPVLFSSCQNKPADEKLNFLFLTCEDISPYLVMYGDSTAKTPNLDRLAKESMIFTHAYTTVGVCAPSRSSIITGMYPISIGTQNMRTAKDYVGWGTRKYDEKSDAVDLEGNNVPLYSAVIPPYVKCFTEYLRKAGYYCSNNFKTDYQFAAPVTAWDANSRTATWKTRKPGQPFFAVFNDMVTHESKIWMNHNLKQTVDPEKVSVPLFFPDNKIVREDIARNFSNIELLDKHIGEKLDELKKAGLLDKTIIFFFSDHGGPFPKEKREYTEDGLHVPFMVRLPHGKGAGYVNDMISFVDIAPTILSLAGIPIPDYMQGQAFLGGQKSAVPRKYIFGSGDRFDNISDRCRSVSDGRFYFVKNFHPELPAYKDVAYRKNMNLMKELLRERDQGELNADQMYWFRKHKTPEELYDSQTDPHCIHNLIDDPRYASKVKELRLVLLNWIKQTHDLGAVPERKIVESMWPGLVQPQTLLPKIEFKNGKITMSCSTEGASIAYLLSDRKISPDLNSGWLLYSNPISKPQNQHLYVLATRIGYKDSEVLELSANELKVDTLGVIN
jgi:N-sulfoglucosamine sulfohydrolase